MIRHQQLNQRPPSALHFVGGRIHHHSGFHGPNAGGRENARADVHDTNAADSDRPLVLLVTESWNRDVVYPRGIEDRGSGRNCNLLAINGEFDERICAHERPKVEAVDLELLAPQAQTPAGHRRCDRCASTSSRKCFRTDAIGAGTTWPRPQMEVRRRVSASSSSRARSEGVLFPRVHPSSISTNLLDPTRQGTHLPQDSLR